MKEIIKTSRLAGQLEKLFRMLNADMFGGQLETPVITIQSTPKAYGHYSVCPIWTVGGEERKHEINIGAGTLDREIEYTVATLLHEMCHMYDDTVLKVQDCSRQGTYHNKLFKATAERVGLVVTKSEKYGYAHTAPSDDLIAWILNNNIQEIRLNRAEGFSARGIGGKGGSVAGTEAGSTTRKGNSRKIVCPCCGMTVRATRDNLRLMCMDCEEQMIYIE